MQQQQSLADAVQYLPGVGPRRAQILAKLGVATVGDLLEYLPFRHECHQQRSIEDLEEGLVATVTGRINRVSSQLGRRGATVSATLLDNTGTCRLSWFNAGWMRDRLARGMVVRATGKVTAYEDLAQLVNPRIEVLGEDAGPADDSAPAEFEGVYPATAELSSRMIGRIISANLDRMLSGVQECHAPEHLSKRKLAPRRWALSVIHRPRKPDDVEAARRRLAYDELLLMQLAVTLARLRHREGPAAQAMRCRAAIDERIRRRFPFKLTSGQDRAIAEIMADLGTTRPMNRLLQGDVGCGKTVVALYAALATVANRCQVALMAPTELLAEQHYRSITQYLKGSRVRHALLVGGLRAAKRREILAGIAGGALDIVVGTHALIQKDVRFDRLGLVVVDEQHRFGVRQRATIRSKGPAPHYLVMTATPIPRTLAMTVFGDLDVTTIDELPPGRSKITTRVAGPREHQSTWRFVLSRVARGEQAFVVYPLIDESDKMAFRAATTEYRRLQEEVFTGHAVGLLHGRLSAEERDAGMRDFVSGKTAALVATTVIEVGIDVPNATCMVIEHAERYGLSQLHQLRGRIGRGRLAGHCFLLTDSAGGESNERLRALVETTDGFRIAEEDLRLRGPGEMLGTRQHGLPDLRVADLVRDAGLLRLAQQDAGEIVRADPSLGDARHGVLRGMLISRYRGRLSLLNVG
ncbi:MAG: ATP-dependent DNA helicase RecG [Planctomycetota bacterium]